MLYMCKSIKAMRHLKAVASKYQSKRSSSGGESVKIKRIVNQHQWRAGGGAVKRHYQ